MADFLQILSPTASVIQIGTTESILGIASILIGIGVAWGTLKNTVANLNGSLSELKIEAKDGVNSVRGEIKDLRGDVKETRRGISNVHDELGNVRERVAVLENRANLLYQSNSPVSLTKEGLKILKESGLKAFIDENKDDLIRQSNHSNAMTNPYDIQKMAFAFFDDIDLPSELEDKLKTNAFDQGASLYMLRRVGGIYFRDLCLKELGFKVPRKIAR